MLLQLRIKLKETVTDHFLMRHYIFDRIIKLIGETNTVSNTVH